MIGISSLKEIDDYVRAHCGLWVARVFSVVLIAGMFGFALAGVALGVGTLKPLGAGAYALLSGHLPHVALRDFAPPFLTLGVFLGLGLWAHRRLSGRLTDVARLQDIIESWLKGPLERRLKSLTERVDQLDRNSVSVEWANWVNERLTSDEQVDEDFRKRLIALENHTDVSGLRKLVAERVMADYRAGKPMTLGALSGLASDELNRSAH